LTLLVAPSLIFPVDGAVDLTNFSSDNGWNSVVSGLPTICCSLVFEVGNVKDNVICNRLSHHGSLAIRSSYLSHRRVVTHLSLGLHLNLRLLICKHRFFFSSLNIVVAVTYGFR
jgi:hypothetical protein